MNNRNKQEQGQTEIPYQTLSEFLENTPPNQLRYISDFAEQQHLGNYLKNKPNLKLHCSDESCDGIRFFRCTWEIIHPGTFLQTDIQNFLYVSYQCSNCQKTGKVYSIMAYIDPIEKLHWLCWKFGEFPLFGPPIPSRLIKLIGPDREIFLKGRNCENQGLGIGAFTYYRRVVENQKNRILEEIIKVFEKINTPQEKINTLRAAIEETQFSKALKMTKDVMPESLLIDGHNPILLLHHALSRGVHELSDEECLKRANTVRLVLGELSERLSAILKDTAELKAAISTLLHDKSS